MNQHEKEQFDKLKKRIDVLEKNEKEFKQEFLVMQTVLKWLQKQVRTGLRDVIQRVVKEEIEIDVDTSKPVMTTDDLLKQELARTN